MKSYVITVMNIPESVKAANRCIESMPEFKVQMYKAVTPENKPMEIAKRENMSLGWFTQLDKHESISRRDRCVSAFLSHYSLWKKCIAMNEEVQIFEHDAVRVGNLPEFINYQGCISLGQPSYGKYNTPKTLGTNPLTSKKYFPGAHAYRINPKGAKALVDHAKTHASPTDVFLTTDTFPWLEEYYPWPVTAVDSFSTIQNEGGCSAKHGYNKDYKLL